MPELPAVESRHAMVDFEKPHMSMNLAVMLKFFEHYLQRLKIRLVEISLFYIEVIFYRIESHHESDHRSVTISVCCNCQLHF